MHASPSAPVATPAIAIIGFFLTLTALSLVTLDRIKYLYLSTGSAGLFGRALASLTPFDITLLVLATVCAIAGLATGLKDRALIRLCAGERPVWLWLLTAALLVWLSHAVLAPGLLVTGDAGTHVARISHLSAALRGGDSVYWDNYFFGGSTLLQFTGPVFHWLAAAVTLLVGDATPAIKLVITAARALAAIFMYRLTRELGVARPAACLAALFYAGGPQMTYMEVVRSSFPQLINLAAMPAILLCVERSWTRPRLFGAPSAGLALAAIVLVGSHQPTAMIFAFYAALYIIARIAADPSRRQAIPALAAAGVMAGVGSLFFLLPFALERGMTADNFSAGSLLSLAAPAWTMLRTLVTWGSLGEGAEYATYFGLPLLLCAGAGVVWFRRWRDPWWVFCGLTLLSLCVYGIYVRQATFTLVFLGAAGALGADRLIRAAAHRPVVPLLLFVAVAVDAGPLALQPWTRSDMAGIVAAGDSLAQRAADSRVMEVWYPTGQPDVSVGPDSTPLHYARVQMLSGPHKQDATPGHNAAAARLKIAATELKSQGKLSDPVRALLATSNIGWIVGTGAIRPGLPAAFADTIPDPILGAHWRIPDATPFLVSDRLEQADRPAAFAAGPFWNTNFDIDDPAARDAMRAVAGFHARMEPDPARRQARALLVPVMPVGDIWRATSNAPPIVRTIGYSVEPGRVRLSVEADRPGFMRLVHPMAASVSVSRDGAPVAAIADVESLIVLPVHAGINEIEVTASPSPPRRICFWLTVATALALLAILASNCLPPVSRYKRRETLSN